VKAPRYVAYNPDNVLESAFISSARNSLRRRYIPMTDDIDDKRSRFVDEVLEKRRQRMAAEEEQA
jgi:hypothetical protein